MKEDYTVKAWFWKDNFHEYRDRTRIIFENEQKCIGIILMLNPGSSYPVDECGKLVKIPENKEYLCKKDQTLRNVIECLKIAYEGKANGYVYIVNLSNKRGPNPKKLSEGDFRKLDDIISEIKERINEQPPIRWIWIAFGKTDTKTDWKDEYTQIHARDMKNKIDISLSQNYPSLIIGNSNAFKYTHPKYFSYQNRSRREKEHIIAEIKARIHPTQSLKNDFERT